MSGACLPVTKAMDICSTVNELHQVKALVPITHVPDSAAHARSLHNLTETCNGQLQPHLQSIGAYTSVCDWHQCFDLAKLVVAHFCISNNAAHICSLSPFTYLCSCPGQPYLQIIEACINLHDQYLCCNPRPEDCGVCRASQGFPNPL
jgi:hypothetical protein